MEGRLKELQNEFSTGHVMLADMERKVNNLKESLLRINGAIQVLEEELAKAGENKTGKKDAPHKT